MLDVSAPVHLPAPLRTLHAPPLVRAVVVERREYLVRDARRDLGDVEERVGEGRRRQLVVLRKRSCEDVEPLGTRVRDDEVGDRGACVVDGERDGEGFGCEEGEQ